MNPVAAPPHVTLSGDRAGEYVVEEERPDGRLVLAPDSKDTYPAVVPAFAGRSATPEEFAAFEAEYGPFLPPDGEG
jgi:hypothetical protein